MLSSILSLTCALALSATTASCAPSLRKSSVPLSGDIHYLFTFGDSYTTTNFDPIGPQPGTTSPFGNPSNIFTNWVYYLTAVLNSTTTLNFNYARGGATIDQHIVAGTNQSVQQQVDDWFLPIAGKHRGDAAWRTGNSLAGIFIGINDIENSYTADESTFQAEIDRLQASYFNIVTDLYNVGLRNFFFVNVPPLQYSGAVQYNGSESTSHWAIMSELYNAALVSNAKAYADLHPDVTTHVFDNNAVWREVLADPTAYGFKDNSTWGEWADDTVVWNNWFHPGSAMNRVVAERMAPELHEVFGF